MSPSDWGSFALKLSNQPDGDIGFHHRVIDPHNGETPTTNPTMNPNTT